jgi:hypothetical protein
MLAEYAADIFPKGVLNVITGDGEPVGAGIVRHPDVRMVSLTGDAATGREVARAASETLKRVHLELGARRLSSSSTTRIRRGRCWNSLERVLELGAGLHSRHPRRHRPENL